MRESCGNCKDECYQLLLSLVLFFLLLLLPLLLLLFTIANGVVVSVDFTVRKGKSV